MADYEDDELEINLRDPDDIGARIVLLGALAIWPDLDAAGERGPWRQWLASNDLLSVATRTERGILDRTSDAQLSKADLDICDRALDSVTVLAWAVALNEDLPPLRLAAEHEELIDRIPIPGEPVGRFLDQLLLQDEDTVSVERERAEIWNWRLAVEDIRRNDTSADYGEIDEAIREVVLESAISFAITEVNGEDFLVEGVPVRRLDDEYLESLVVMTEERLRALNWLCGLTEWEIIHLPD
jgi:hypothetical protein